MHRFSWCIIEVTFSLSVTILIVLLSSSMNVCFCITFESSVCVVLRARLLSASARTALNIWSTTCSMFGVPTHAHMHSFACVAQSLYRLCDMCTIICGQCGALIDLMILRSGILFYNCDSPHDIEGLEGVQKSCGASSSSSSDGSSQIF